MRVERIAVRWPLGRGIKRRSSFHSVDAPRFDVDRDRPPRKAPIARGEPTVPTKGCDNTMERIDEVDTVHARNKSVSERLTTIRRNAPVRKDVANNNGRRRNINRS